MIEITEQGTTVIVEVTEGIKGDLNFAQVSTYALMLLLPITENLRIVKVLNDENKEMTDTLYQLWPDGTRMWIASTKDN